METGLKTILAATDFSRTAAAAARRAAWLAKTGGARLELLHVVPELVVPESWTPIREALGLDPARLLREQAHTRLKGLAAHLELETGCAADVHVAHGRAHVEIAARAAAIGTDLVAVGAHGQHFLLDAFVGSTAQRVLRACDGPVLVGRLGATFSVEQVLIATDFSPSSAAAARTVRRLFPHAVFHLLHVIELPYEAMLSISGVNEEVVQECRQQAAQQARRELESFAREAGFGAQDGSLKVQLGRAPQRIAERAAELDADLIVMGTYGRSQLEAGLLGSVSLRVLAESRCDVLLVKGERLPTSPGRVG